MSDYTLRDLTIALEASLKLQSHYAGLLNMYDGGERLMFGSVDAWMERLRETGDLLPLIEASYYTIYDYCGEEIPADEANDGGDHGTLCNDCYAELG